jgi:hypothetical protein
MTASNSGQLTVELCRAKAIECLHLANGSVLRSQRIMLEHIAETWYRIADRSDGNDAEDTSQSPPH